MQKETKAQCEKRWTDACAEFLVGKRIKAVRYLTEAEMNKMGWYSRPLVIIFEDGSHIFPMQDDEGNNGGALATSNKQLETIPVLQ